MQAGLAGAPIYSNTGVFRTTRSASASRLLSCKVLHVGSSCYAERVSSIHTCQQLQEGEFSDGDSVLAGAPVRVR